MDTSAPKPPGFYLKQWRDAKAPAMNDATLAQALDIEQPTLRRFLTGDSYATEHLVARLYALTGIPIMTWWKYENAWRRSSGFSRK